MTTRLKIDLAEGVLEVEGSEAFVKAIYNDFKTHFIGEDAVDEDMFRPKRKRRRRKSKPTKTKAKSTPPPPKPEPPEKVQEKAEEAEAEKPEPPAPKPRYKFIEDLSLAANDDHPSLVEFMDAKFPITNEERNLVFVHYLQNLLSLKSITIDHVYTCYKAANIRVPFNIEKSLHMAANWINISKTGKLTVTAAGKRYVENQLPKRVKT